jgi:hypothetical protein
MMRRFALLLLGLLYAVAALAQSPQPAGQNANGKLAAAVTTANAVTEDLENLKRFVGTWKQEPRPDPTHDVAQAVIFKIEGGRLIGMERQLSYRNTNGEFFLDRDEFTPTGELKVKGKTVSWRTRRLKYLGEGMDIQTRVTLTSDNEAVLDFVGEISEGDQPLMLVPFRITLKKQP